jgi:hypothetical protein
MNMQMPKTRTLPCVKILHNYTINATAPTKTAAMRPIEPLTRTPAPVTYTGTGELEAGYVASPAGAVVALV